MKFLVIIGSFLFAVNCFAEETVEKSFGTAKNKKGEVVYLEEHTSRFVNGSLKYLGTKYSKSNGKSFGFIQSDFAKSPNIPSYKFVDKRHGRVAEIKWIQGGVMASAKENKESKAVQKIFPVTVNTVAGQGLHSYLRNNLEAFIANHNLEKKIDFLIPMNQEVYSFRIRTKDFDKSNRTIKLRIEADSWVFRIVAPHIDVTYNIDSQRLVEYKGPSNLLDDQGEKMDVTIAYLYEK